MREMDYCKLNGRIKEYGHSLRSFSEVVGISYGHFCEKMKSQYPFTQTEIEKICDHLEIDPDDIGIYFFKKKVEENSTKGA